MNIRMLGPLEVISDAGEALGLGGRNQRAVFAMLLINRGTLVARDRIIEAVWGENLPADPANTLQHYVSRLRSILGPVAGTGASRLIERVDGGYRLTVPAAWVDADRFHLALGDATTARRRGSVGEAETLLTGGLDEWRGEPFEDLTYCEFLQEDIRRLAETRLDAYEELFDARLALGRHRESVEELAGLANRHYLRERFWQQLMLALYRSGRQAEALRAYQEARRRLGRELGIDPGPELNMLEERILLADPDLQLVETSTPLSKPPRPHNLPAFMTSFVGRRAAIDEVATLLDRRRLVTIMGTSGVGKTRLAIEVASRMVDQFPDGVRFVSLDAVTEPGMIEATVAAAVGLPEDPNRDLIDTLSDHLADTNTLLILDGCEHVAAPCARLVAAVQSRGTTLRVLVTSQVALGVEGETRFTLSPMTTDEATTSDAVALFVDRARQIVPDYDPQDVEREHILNIGRNLDGSPLGIELAAVRLDVLSVEQIEHDLADGLDLATQLPVTDSRRHRTLGEAIEWSVHLLGDVERGAFETLTVFADGFDRDAAAAVAFPSWGTQETTDILLALTAKSILRVERSKSDPTPRYTMPPALRSFGRKNVLMRSPQGNHEISARHARWYGELATQSDFELRGPHYQRWLRVIDANQANLGNAMVFARDTHDFELLNRIVGRLARYWDWRGQYAKATSWISQALSDSGASESDDHARVLVWAAYFTAVTGDIGEAETIAHKAIVVADRHHYTEHQSSARGVLSIILRQTEHLDEALAPGQEAVVIARRAGDDWFHAWASTVLAVAHLGTGNTTQAHDLGTTSLETFRRLSDQGGEAWSLNILAAVALRTGNLTSAKGYAHDALLYAHLLGVNATIIEALETLAEIARVQGHVVDATRLMSAASALHHPTVATLTVTSNPSRAVIEQLRSQIPADQFADAWEAGQQIDLEAVLNS